jgi:hypothetical protein
VAIDIVCPVCGEEEDLRGSRGDGVVAMSCVRCGHRWRRDLAPTCPRCGGRDLQEAALAIVEKGRGTQLSIVGTRRIHLCTGCDAATLERYFRNLPNPLMPDDLPTVGPGD